MMYEVDRMEKRKKAMKRKSSGKLPLRREAQIDPGPVMGELLHDEGGEQEPSAEQQPADQSRIQPVEPVALVQRGVEQAESDARIDDT